MALPNIVVPIRIDAGIDDRSRTTVLLSSFLVYLLQVLPVKFLEIFFDLVFQFVLFFLSFRSLFSLSFLLLLDLAEQLVLVLSVLFHLHLFLHHLIPKAQLALTGTATYILAALFKGFLDASTFPLASLRGAPAPPLAPKLKKDSFGPMSDLSWLPWFLESSLLRVLPISCLGKNGSSGCEKDDFCYCGFRAMLGEYSLLIIIIFKI